MGCLGKGVPEDGLSDADRAAKMIQNVLYSVQGNPTAKPETKTIIKKKRKISTKSLKLDEVDLINFQNNLANSNLGSSYDRAARNRPGSSVAEWVYFTTEDTLPTPSTVQQKIQYLISQDPVNTMNQCRLPEGESLVIWQYEHLRQITMQLNDLVVCLGKQCTKSSCPMMHATEKYEFRCAAHKSVQDCCAIDYMIHNLDNTAAQLNSNKLFPSRIAVKDDDIKHCQNLAKRIYRFFPHAYYHHRDIYDAFEGETYLCKRFLTLCKMYSLVDDSALLPTIPGIKI
jgi:hypothetical protein